MNILRTLALVCCWPAVCLAQVTLLTEHLPPFQIVKESDISGSGTQIIRSVFKDAEVNYTIEAHSWSDAYNIALRNPNVCLFSTSRIPEREALFHWVGQIDSMQTSFYRSASRDFNISSVEEARDYTVAAIKDDVSHQFLVSNGFVENQNLYVLHNYDALMRLLDLPNRHIDLVLLNASLLQYRVKETGSQLNYTPILAVEELTLYFYLACNLSTDLQVMQRLKDSFSTLEDNGQLSAIREKWGLPALLKWPQQQAIQTLMPES